MEAWYGTDIPSFLKAVDTHRFTKVFFHNLKFDGIFLIDWFENNGWEFGYDYDAIITDMGVWYQIRILRPFKCSIWDSLKKFPDQSVNDIAHLYGIEGKKEKPYFDMYRPPGYEPTQQEIDYCVQDSHIIAYAIKRSYEEGRKRMTLSSDAFHNLKTTIPEFKEYFPMIPDMIDGEIRRSYRGGFTYVNPIYKNKNLEDIWVYDVNSLYPHCMRNNPMPVGQPELRKPYGDELYIINFVGRFELNPGFLPTYQIKELSFNPRLYATSTEGLLINITLTSIDYELMKKHYEIEIDSEPVYYSFKKKEHLFDAYIDHWMKVKEEATVNKDVPLRYIAKRYLNSTYGKFGTKSFRFNKIPNLKANGAIKWETKARKINPIYLPVATFITSYARRQTITSAQKYVDCFVYADTDSLHLIGEDNPDIEVHDTKLGAWKRESHWATGKYIRAKSYIHGDEAHNVLEAKVAGMPESAKQNITWDTFAIGNTFTGKLQRVQCPGGCYLKDIEFTIKEEDSFVW